jgi:hypothetical protein
MKWLVLKSWLLLVYCEFVMLFRGFRQVHDLVRKEKIHPATSGHILPSVELCHAIDLACVLYFKEVKCLQRSAATTLLLRRYGWNAGMVIGAQIFPFKSHAWVEIGGSIVNDKPWMLDIYRVLERC